MKRIAAILAVLLLPFVLAACTSGTNSNTNTVVLDLVNEATNTAVILNQNANSNTNAAANVNAQANSNANMAANVNASTGTAVRITTSGFSPSTVTVKVGTVVTWTNGSGDTARVSSDPHPTHTTLPGFDSTSLGGDETYTFTFTKVGTWGYHNHEDPAMTGTVIVQ